MPRDEMPAQPPVGRERAFQIHQRAPIGELKIRARPSLAEQVELQPRAAFPPGDFRGRKAAAIHRDAVPRLGAARAGTGAHRHANGLRRLADALDAARFFDNASEHVAARSRNPRQLSTPVISLNELPRPAGGPAARGYFRLDTLLGLNILRPIARPLVVPRSWVAWWNSRNGLERRSLTGKQKVKNR